MINLTTPAPMFTQEANDCAICATQYVCRWFGVPADRDAIKRAAGWTSALGACPPEAYLQQQGLQAPMWCCRDLVWEPDPERPGVQVQRPGRNWDILYRSYVERLASGCVGLVHIVLPAGDHEVVVVGAEPAEGSLWVGCSLRGLYKAPKEDFFTSPAGKLQGRQVTWVWKEGPDALAVLHDHRL